MIDPFLSDKQAAVFVCDFSSQVHPGEVGLFFFPELGAEEGGEGFGLAQKVGLDGRADVGLGCFQDAFPKLLSFFKRAACHEPAEGGGGSTAGGDWLIEGADESNFCFIEIVLRKLSVRDFLNWRFDLTY